MAQISDKIASIPVTRQGVRDLSQLRSPVLPVSGKPAARGEGKNVGDVERWISALSGVALTYFGLTRANLPGLGLAALGGSLLYRGLTGHCHLYQATGINTAEQLPSGMRREHVYQM